MRRTRLQIRVLKGVYVIEYTKEDLQAFEDDIRQCFLRGEIRYPVHFSAGNESQLISIFKENDIANRDNWVFTTHRSHLHALLKGIPKDWLKEQIIKGNSMHIMSQEYKFFSSSIVGGSLPIAVGTALAIKRKGLNERVFAFLGDMACETGIYNECWRYSHFFELPITFIIECNSLSTNSPTYECWGKTHGHTIGGMFQKDDWFNGGIIGYCYERLCEHINVGQFVEFK
jgi:TPP-dependent pyruvate/acetoin dehydrogenase alpha subunit